jgi:two-component system sensor histidine kinase YesM
MIPESELTRGTEYIRRTIWWTGPCHIIDRLFDWDWLCDEHRSTDTITSIFHEKSERRRLSGSRVDIESKDEIGQLTNDFNKMVEKLQVLLDEIYYSQLREKDLQLRQKETELKVLQSQVNPHFFMNALETVRGMALEKDMTDISVLVASLLDYFVTI